MAEQQTQQQDQTINLGTGLNIGVLMGALMDLQQLVRTLPNILAAADQLKTQVSEKDAKIAELESRLASLAPKAVEEAKAE